MQSSHAENVPDSLVDPLATDRRIVADARPRERDPIPILRVDRTDLTFRFEASGMVDIRIRVTNPGPGMSPPRRGRIEEAPFGAFVPWTPLTVFSVPGLMPGESTLVELRVPRAAIGGEPPPDPPTTALLAEPPEETRVARFVRHFQLLLSSLMKREEDPAAPYLAGNLNVHIGPTSVERHLSGPLRIYPGRANVARFVVGNGADAYRFHLCGEGANWNPFLTCFKAYTDDKPEQILQDTWYQWCKQENLWLEVIPPAECRRGGLEVQIEQRSTGRIALVEFDLDADAREGGCYTV